MKISIIIPFYKEIDLIRKTIDSILEQDIDLDKIEIIICNDGPIPKSKILSQIDAHTQKIIKIIKNNGIQGPGGARNSGINAAQGDIIAFLDADDCWLPGKLQAQLSEIKNGVNFIVTGYQFKEKNIHISPPKSLEDPFDIFIKRGIGTSTVVTTKDLIGAHRFRDIRFAQDIDFWHRLAKSPNFKYKGIHRTLTSYSTQGSTKSKLEQLKYVEKILTINKTPFFMKVKILSSYILSGIKNHYLKPLIK